MRGISPDKFVAAPKLQVPTEASPITALAVVRHRCIVVLMAMYWHVHSAYASARLLVGRTGCTSTCGATWTVSMQA